MEDFLEEVTGITYVTSLENNLCCTAIIWEMLSVPNPKSTDFFCLLSLSLPSLHFPFSLGLHVDYRFFFLLSAFFLKPPASKHAQVPVIKNKTNEINPLLKNSFPDTMSPSTSLPFTACPSARVTFTHVSTSSPLTAHQVQNAL